MKPKKVTIEGEHEERQKYVCDEIMYRAARMMLEEVKATMPMMLDRMLTYAAAQACKVDGSANTAAAFRTFAEKIEKGIFHSVTEEGQKGH